MNSPFTREEQMFAMHVKNLAHNTERLCTLMESVLARLDAIESAQSNK